MRAIPGYRLIVPGDCLLRSNVRGFRLWKSSEGSDVGIGGIIKKTKTAPVFTGQGHYCNPDPTGRAVQTGGTWIILLE
jgi:hypothetical protein